MSKPDKRGQPGVHRTLAALPREPKVWLRPTFLVRRGIFHDFNRVVQLDSVYVAVLSVDPAKGTATYEVLGSNASPATVSIESLSTMLKERGVKQ